jgi:hypothetical protein
MLLMGQVIRAERADRRQDLQDEDEDEDEEGE